MAGFKMGTLDHMHLMVPDRYAAADWYRQHLGFEIVERYRVWADVEGGPLHISADGGQSALALFEDGQHPAFKVETAVAFRVDAQAFVAFAQALDGMELEGMRGERLTPASVVDHDLCYAFYFADPYGNRLELDCYDHERVRRDLVERYEITPVRFW